MPYDQHLPQKSNPFKQVTTNDVNIRNIYYGEVVSIKDDTDGGRIKVKILSLDNDIVETNDLPDWVSPCMFGPKSCLITHPEMNIAIPPRAARIGHMLNAQAINSFTGENSRRR